jgi:type I restriction enzyme S subunit
MKTYKIEDCCDILDSHRIPLNKQQRQKIQGKVPYYGANGVQDYINDFIFDEDLILIAEDGGNFEQFATRPIAYKISGKSWVNNHAHILRAKSGFDQDFIFYSLVNKNILNFISGGTRSKLNQSELRAITLDLPEHKEQNKIAEILVTIDRAIAQTEALIAKHQRIKTGLMQDLLTRGIDEHGQLRDPSTHRFKSTPLGMVPEEWKVAPLSTTYKSPIRDFGSFSMTNLIDFIDSGVPFIKSEMIEEENLNPKSVMYISPEVHQALKKSWVYPGNVLYSKIGSALGNALVYDGRFGVCNSNAAVAKIDVDEKIALSNYIVMVLNSSETRLRLKQSIVSLLPRLNLTDISNFELRLPSIPEQRRMIEVRQGLLDEINNEKTRLEKLQKMKTGLMQDLLSGKVSIKPLIEG